ncbi:MAG: hypothetical protein HKN87_00070 [Saprospiraceae bacterium]|nr:hypothetical protein [Saprospiraceae bacterium]
MMVSSVLVLLLLAVSVRDFLTVVSFKIHRDSIAQKYCVNIDAPKDLCHGQCFLATRLEKQVDQEQKLPAIKLNDQTLFVAELYIWSDQRLIESSSDLIRQAGSLWEIEVIYDIFHPPKVMV